MPITGEPDDGEGYVRVSGDNMTGDLTLGTDKITLDATGGNGTFIGDVTADNALLTTTDDAATSRLRITNSDGNSNRIDAIVYQKTTLNESQYYDFTNTKIPAQGFAEVGIKGNQNTGCFIGTNTQTTPMYFGAGLYPSFQIVNKEVNFRDGINIYRCDTDLDGVADADYALTRFSSNGQCFYTGINANENTYLMRARSRPENVGAAETVLDIKQSGRVVIGGDIGGNDPNISLDPDGSATLADQITIREYPTGDGVRIANDISIRKDNVTVDDAFAIFSGGVTDDDKVFSITGQGSVETYGYVLVNNTITAQRSNDEDYAYRARTTNADGTTNALSFAVRCDGRTLVGGNIDAGPANITLMPDGSAIYKGSITVDDDFNASELWLKNGVGLGSGNGAILRFANGGNSYISYHDASNQFMNFQINGSEMMRLQNKDGVGHRIALGDASTTGTDGQMLAVGGTSLFEDDVYIGNIDITNRDTDGVLLDKEGQVTVMRRRGKDPDLTVFDVLKGDASQGDPIRTFKLTLGGAAEFAGGHTSNKGTTIGPGGLYFRNDDANKTETGLTLVSGGSGANNVTVKINNDGSSYFKETLNCESSIYSQKPNASGFNFQAKDANGDYYFGVQSSGPGSGSVIIGGTAADPNIELNVDGSSSFADAATFGTFNTGAEDVNGTKVALGSVQVQQEATVANSTTVFRALHGKTPTVWIRANGNADFQGSVSVADELSSKRAAFNYDQGQTGQVVGIYPGTGSSTPSISMNADGSAHFKGNVTSDGTIGFELTDGSTLDVKAKLLEALETIEQLKTRIAALEA